MHGTRSNLLPLLVQESSRLKSASFFVWSTVKDLAAPILAYLQASKHLSLLMGRAVDLKDISIVTLHD